jgi:Pro-kumamolisin, activation domain
MKHLKPAAKVASLAILVVGSLSCSSVPPAPQGGSASNVGVGYRTRVPCIPEAVANRRAAMTGAVDLRQPLKVALQLPLRNQAQLTQLLHDLYDPKSPRYHQYLSVSAFTR